MLGTEILRSHRRMSPPRCPALRSSWFSRNTAHGARRWRMNEGLLWTTCARLYGRSMCYLLCSNMPFNVFTCSYTENMVTEPEFGSIPPRIQEQIKRTAGHNLSNLAQGGQWQYYSPAVQPNRFKRVGEFVSRMWGGWQDGLHFIKIGFVNESTSRRWGGTILTLLDDLASKLLTFSSWNYRLRLTIVFGFGIIFCIYSHFLIRSWSSLQCLHAFLLLAIYCTYICTCI